MTPRAPSPHRVHSRVHPTHQALSALTPHAHRRITGLGVLLRLFKYLTLSFTTNVLISTALRSGWHLGALMFIIGLFHCSFSLMVATAPDLSHAYGVVARAPCTG